jgi:hypothetical protein
LEGYFWKSYKSLRCYLFPFLRELKSPRKRADRDALIVYEHSPYVFFINQKKCFPYNKIIKTLSAIKHYFFL